MISVHSAPRAAFGGLGTGVRSGVMRCRALPAAQAAPAIASPTDLVAADLASAAPTSARSDANASPQASMAARLGEVPTSVATTITGGTPKTAGARRSVHDHDFDHHY